MVKPVCILKASRVEIERDVSVTGERLTRNSKPAVGTRPEAHPTAGSVRSTLKLCTDTLTACPLQARTSLDLHLTEAIGTNADKLM